MADEGQGALPDRPLLSVITPAYNEAANLPVLFERLQQTLAAAGVDWEWIVVDDHSTDGTFGVVSELAAHHPYVFGMRLARNSGSHIAMRCGLHHARGQATVIMAADLQDPPEALPGLLERWREGSQVVWAVRRRREGEKTSTVGFSRFYYFLMRTVVGMKEMPSTGADFFLIDRRVVEAYERFHEHNVSIMALITWMGFRQTAITYDKQARLHGKSGWSLGSKIKLVIDSMVSFSYLPLRIMSLLGVSAAFVGFLYASLVIFNAARGIPPQGWASLMVVVLIIGGAQMLMMGVLGEYLWRALDEARGRPSYLVEADTSSWLQR